MKPDYDKIRELEYYCDVPPSSDLELSCGTPETLSTFPTRHRGRPPKYDWDEITDGQIHVLRKGRDFQTSAVSFRALAHRTASARGMRVTTTIQKATPDQEEAVVVQFYAA